jgi:hypothetical protein
MVRIIGLCGGLLAPGFTRAALAVALGGAHEIWSMLESREVRELLELLGEVDE